MTDVAWRVEARRLLATVRSVQIAARELGPAAWIAREAGRLRTPGVGVRWASRPGVLGLGPFAGLDDPWTWVVEPEAGDGARLVRVVVDADGVLLRADAPQREASREPVAVGGRHDDETVRLVVLDHDDLIVAARRTLAGAAAVTVRAEWDVDRLWSIDVLVETADGGGVLRHHGWVHPRLDEIPADRRRRVDRLVRDASGVPAEWWDDTPADATDASSDQPEAFEDDPEAATPGEDLDALLELAADGLEPGREVPTGHLRWSRRLHGEPPPLPERTSDAVRAGAAAMLGTILRAAEASGVPDPCAILLDHGWGDRDEDPVLPELVVVDRAYRERFRALPPESSAASTSTLRHAVGAGQGARVPLVDHADDETLRHWLPLRRGSYGTPGIPIDERMAAGRLLAALRERLTVELLEHDFGPPWAGPVLPWLAIGEDVDDEVGDRTVRPWDELRRHAEPETFAALRRAWPSRTTANDRIAAARRSRVGLRRLLDAEGLGAHAGPLAEAARPGFVLDEVPDGGPTPRSRVAGPALLPAGVAWPTTEDGEPLTFVAAIDLAELPATDDAHPLPEDGVLLIYVLVGDPDPDEGMLEFVEAEEEGATVFHVPAGTAPVPADAPTVGVLRVSAPYDRPRPIEDRAPAAAVPVVLRPVLEPVQDYDVADRFGLHPSEAERYEHVVWGLLPEDDGRDASDAEDPWDGGDDALGEEAREGGDEGDDGSAGADLLVTWMVDDSAPGDGPPVGESDDGADRPQGAWGGLDGPDAPELMRAFMRELRPDVEIPDDIDPAALRDIVMEAGREAIEIAKQELAAGTAERDMVVIDDEDAADGVEVDDDIEDLEDDDLGGDDMEDLEDDDLEDDDLGGPLDLPDGPFGPGTAFGTPVSGTVLGTEAGVQGHPLEDDEIVLLALAGTPELGLEWGDGGDLRVLIRAEDAAAGRWDRAWATGDCG